ncbi:MAG: DoxX family protein [Candidatus Marinimicrobia bacterium]|jgi:diacylglycerol kinase|nr:DoxX family protein [Candidatus Neomarinimicrobiota bacterium]
MNEIFSYENLLINLIQSLIGVFISIALIQSSIDKLIDRKGNLEWLSDHFSDTILRNFVPLVLLIITITELFSGLLLLSGAFINILFSNFDLLIIGFFLSAINFILLFFGQRIAKDYAGAAVIVNYFILNILGLISILFSFFK